MRGRLIARYVLEGIVTQLGICVKYGMPCRNPPALTTGLLFTLGLSSYEVRSFWRSLKDYIKRGKNSVTLLRYHDVEFRSELEFKSGSVCLIDRGVYADVHDCSPYGDRVKMLTNVNKAYVFIKGYLDGEAFIKVNVVYLLKKLIDLNEADIADALVSIARRLVEGVAPEDELRSIGSVITSLLRFSNELSELMVYIPRNLSEAIAFIPVLRSNIGRWQYRFNR